VTYRFHPEARLEYLEAIVHYLEAGDDVAEGFVREVEGGIAFILRNPHACAPAGKSARRYILRRFPFAICYTVTGDTVLIVAVMHLKRRPRYWHHRLKGT
jgi:plasmid stabilization system protein ParE